MDQITRPFRKSMDETSSRAMTKKLALIIVSAALGFGSLPVFFFVGWMLGSAMTLASVVAAVAVFVINENIKEEWNQRTNKIHRLRSRPNGFVPERVRARIKEHREKFEGVFLLFEANWSWQEAPKPANPDPLVLGYAHGSWYVIAEFDLTDKEKFLRDEFTFGGE